MKKITKIGSYYINKFDFLFLVSVKDSSSSYLYKEIVHFYTTQEVWYLPTEVTENTPLVQAQSNIVQCCLLTEGLGLIAQNLQNDYDIYLLKTLYLIIERAGISLTVRELKLFYKQIKIIDYFRQWERFN